MADQHIPGKIADEAARWFAERDAGLIEDAALDAWLAADPRHAAAFAEIEATWAGMAGMRAARDVRASLPPPTGRPLPLLSPVHRLRRWVPGAVAAGVALVAIGTASDLPTRLRADAMTATGERRTVALPDGSTVQLNTHSAIAYDYDGDKRVVRLLTGEAAFTVAPDPARPFTVEAEGGQTTALGTRFLVREDDGEVRVTVIEHRVRVAYPERGRSLRVGEGESVAYGPGHGLGRGVAVDARDAEAWTEGLLVFENRPLVEVVAEIGRYHPGYIRLIGKDVRDRRVSGVFRIDDPVGAIARIERSLGLRSVRITDRLILLYA